MEGSKEQISNRAKTFPNDLNSLTIDSDILIKINTNRHLNNGNESKGAIVLFFKEAQGIRKTFREPKSLLNNFITDGGIELRKGKYKDSRNFIKKSSRVNTIADFNSQKKHEITLNTTEELHSKTNRTFTSNNKDKNNHFMEHRNHYVPLLTEDNKRTIQVSSSSRRKETNSTPRATKLVSNKKQKEFQDRNIKKPKIDENTQKEQENEDNGSQSNIMKKQKMVEHIIEVNKTIAINDITSQFENESSKKMAIVLEKRIEVLTKNNIAIDENCKEIEEESFQKADNSEKKSKKREEFKQASSSKRNKNNAYINPKSSSSTHKDNTAVALTDIKTKREFTEDTNYQPTDRDFTELPNNFSTESNQLLEISNSNTQTIKKKKYKQHVEYMGFLNEISKYLPADRKYSSSARHRERERDTPTPMTTQENGFLRSTQSNTNNKQSKCIPLKEHKIPTNNKPTILYDEEYNMIIKEKRKPINTEENFNMLLQEKIKNDMEMKIKKKKKKLQQDSDMYIRLQQLCLMTKKLRSSKFKGKKLVKNEFYQGHNGNLSKKKNHSKTPSNTSTVLDQNDYYNTVLQTNQLINADINRDEDGKSEEKDMNEQHEEITKEEYDIFLKEKEDQIMKGNIVSTQEDKVKKQQLTKRIKLILNKRRDKENDEKEDNDSVINKNSESKQMNNTSFILSEEFKAKVQKTLDKANELLSKRELENFLKSVTSNSSMKNHDDNNKKKTKDIITNDISKLKNDNNEQKQTDFLFQTKPHSIITSTDQEIIISQATQKDKQTKQHSINNNKTEKPKEFIEVIEEIEIIQVDDQSISIKDDSKDLNTNLPQITEESKSGVSNDKSKEQIIIDFQPIISKNIRENEDNYFLTRKKDIQLDINLFESGRIINKIIKSKAIKRIEMYNKYQAISKGSIVLNQIIIQTIIQKLMKYASKCQSYNLLCLMIHEVFIKPLKANCLQLIHDVAYEEITDRKCFDNTNGSKEINNIESISKSSIYQLSQSNHQPKEDEDESSSYHFNHTYLYESFEDKQSILLYPNSADSDRLHRVREFLKKQHESLDDESNNTSIFSSYENRTQQSFYLESDSLFNCEQLSLKAYTSQSARSLGEIIKTKKDRKSSNNLNEIDHLNNNQHDDAAIPLSDELNNYHSNDTKPLPLSENTSSGKRSIIEKSNTLNTFTDLDVSAEKDLTIGIDWEYSIDGQKSHKDSIKEIGTYTETKQSKIVPVIDEEEGSDGDSAQKKSINEESGSIQEITIEDKTGLKHQNSGNYYNPNEFQDIQDYDNGEDDYVNELIQQNNNLILVEDIHSPSNEGEDDSSNPNTMQRPSNTSTDEDKKLFVYIMEEDNKEESNIFIDGVKSFTQGLVRNTAEVDLLKDNITIPRNNSRYNTEDQCANPFPLAENDSKESKTDEVIDSQVLLAYISELPPEKINSIADELYDEMLDQEIINLEDILPTKRALSKKEQQMQMRSSQSFGSSQSSPNKNSFKDNDLFYSTSYSCSSLMRPINDIKKEITLHLYNNQIAPLLFNQLSKEIERNFPKICNMISIPFEHNPEMLMNALKLKDEQLLAYSKPQIPAIPPTYISKDFLIEFNQLNQQKRLEENVSYDDNYDDIMNECIVDAANELIEKQRRYGNVGIPLPWSLRSKDVDFKYKEDKESCLKLQATVLSQIKSNLDYKMGLIPQNNDHLDSEQLNQNREKKFIKSIIGELFAQEPIWKALDQEETEIKLILSKSIMEQLLNEVVEILEHVQLSRREPSIYQYKSIYSCEDIPRLSFQNTIKINHASEEVDTVNQ